MINWNFCILIAVLLCNSVDAVRPIQPHSLLINTRCWTGWYDRDNPSGTGDWELLTDLRNSHPGQICNNVLEVDVETTSGRSVNSTGNVIAVFDETRGFVCRNRDQPGKKRCQDFRVRFRCPPCFCAQQVCWTDWLNSDSPRGNGDRELTGILRRRYPGVICQQPLLMEVVRADTHAPFAATGQFARIFNPTRGFLCRNQDQSNGEKCHDYKVRFGCPCASKLAPQSAS